MRNGVIAVYITANRKNGAIYAGCTSDLRRRAYEYREGALPGFTSRYGCKRLVWYEPHKLIVQAMQRERTIKRYSRKWKINLIQAENPDWLDLYERLNW